MKKLLIFIFFVFIFQVFAAHGEIVKSVIDGDTLLLDTNEKVRLIGVDTPELYHPLKTVQYFAKEASAFTRQIAEGKTVKLAFDWQKKDKYNRLLAYVYLQDGTFINAEIIKQGYGFAYTKYPFKYLDKFRQYEKEARAAGKGLWKGEGEAELSWLIKEGNKPFLVYEMENSLWGIRFAECAKTRIDSEELMGTLSNIRIWANELSPRDLKVQLMKTGWKPFK